MKSYRANTKIIVITDYMTKWTIAKAVPRESEYEIAETLIEEIFLKFGTPDEILTDRGKSFNTEMIRIIYTEFNTKHITTTPYHPQTNGLTERFNRTLSTMLSMYVNRHHRNWDEYLPYVVFAYNTVAQDSTGQSPYYLLFGMQARMLTDVDRSVNTSTLSEKFEHLHEARELAIRANQIAQRRQKEYYDRNRYSQEFEVNDLVLIHRSKRRFTASPRTILALTSRLIRNFSDKDDLSGSQFVATVLRDITSGCIVGTRSYNVYKSR